MLLLGLASLFQIIFLPGFLIVALLKMNDGLIKTFLLSFAISLVVNYFLVSLLVLLGLYTALVIYSFFTFEIIAILLLFNYRKKIQKNEPCIRYQETFSLLSKQSLSSILSISVALLFSLYFLFHLIISPKSVIFINSDAVLRWNAWAISWLHGIRPTTWNYPQLLPINWSLTYKFIGSDNIQLFAKAIIPLFPFALMMGMMDLFFRTKKIGYVFGAIITSILLITILTYMIFQGYADLGCAFLGFMAIYLLLISEINQNKKTILKNIYIGTFITAGAVLIKQAGLFIAFVYPALTYYLVLKNNSLFKRKDKIKILLTISLILIASILVGYIHATTPPAMQPLDPSDILLSALSYYSFSFYQRIVFGIGLITQTSFEILFLCIFLPILMLLGMFINKKMRLLLSWLVLPYFIIWLLFFSYDIRNLSLILPIIGVTTGLSLAWLINIYTIKVSRGIRIIFLLVICIAGLMMFGTNQWLTTKMRRNQIRRKYQYMGDTSFNRNILYYFQTHDHYGRIMTNYIFLQHLPGFEKLTSYDDISNPSSFYNKVFSSQPKYILINKYVLCFFLRKMAINREHINNNEATTKREIYARMDKHDLKKYKVTQYSDKYIVQKSWIKNHYQVLYNTPDLLFMKKK